MDEAILIYNLIFILFVYCLVYPPAEFISSGLTLNHICARWLGSEEMQFIQYHRKRTTLTIFCHSLLPFIYLFMYFIQFGDILEDSAAGYANFMIWNSFVVSAISLPLFAIGICLHWYLNEWTNHPLSKNLLKYCNNDNDWHRVGASVNDEFRRHDIIITKINSISSVIATENWIIKTSPYWVYLAHQSDTALVATKSDTHPIGEDSSDSVQFVNILVRPTRAGVRSFSIRINALDFKDLQDRINRPIVILSGVTFNRSVIERFIEVFKEQIEMNPKYKTDQVTDSCFACMQTEPNIKLHKHCHDIDENGAQIAESMRCGTCYCRPMWCVSCLAKWFASRQNEYEKEIWLQQKCTCPMCRAQFCILDVCYIDKEQ